MPASSGVERLLGWWVPWAVLGVALTWLVWVLVPSPWGSWWFDVYAVPAAITCVFAAAAVGMWRGLSPRGALAWLGLFALGVILVLHGFLVWITWTFPADF